MSFNLNALYANLQEEAAKREQMSSGPRSAYRTLFIKPDGRAKLNVRILFNVASNAVTFNYRVHKMNDGKTLLCGKNNRNNEHCDLCDALAAKKAVTGVDQKEAASSRAILFAQYISSVGYDHSEKYPEPKQGDIIIVMGPSSLHGRISEMLSTQGLEHLPRLLTDVNGAVVSIGRDEQGRQVTVVPTFATFQSAPSAEQFTNLLNQLPSLEQIGLNGGMTEEDFTAIANAAAAVMRTIQNPVAPTTARPSVDAIVQQQQQQQQPVYTPPTPAMQQPVQQSFSPQQIYDAQYNVQKQVPNVGEQVLQPVQPIQQAVQPVLQAAAVMQPVAQPAVAQVAAEEDALAKLLKDIGGFDADNQPF